MIIDRDRVEGLSPPIFKEGNMGIVEIQNQIDSLKASKWHAITMEVDEKKIESLSKKISMMYMRLCVLMQQNIA